MTKTTKEQVEDWDKVLDEYESSVGLGLYNNFSGFSEAELNEYFTMNRTGIEKLTPEEYVEKINKICYCV